MCSVNKLCTKYEFALLTFLTFLFSVGYTVISTLRDNETNYIFYFALLFVLAFLLCCSTMADAYALDWLLCTRGGKFVLTFFLVFLPPPMISLWNIVYRGKEMGEFWWFYCPSVVTGCVWEMVPYTIYTMVDAYKEAVARDRYAGAHYRVGI